MSKRKTQSKSNVAWLSILAIFLVAVIVCGVITHGFQDWTMCGCFGHKYVDGVCSRCGQEKPAEEEQPQNNAIISDGESYGIVVASTRLLYSQYEENGIEPQADTAYKLTATIQPATTTNQEVDWSVAFVNSSSEWANDKTVTDYVTVTPTFDGALTANVACKQAFGEQIKVTATLRDNIELSANCMVDYRKRLTSVTTTLSNSAGSGGTLHADNDTAIILYSNSSASTDYKLSVTLNESIGTISNTSDYKFYLNGTTSLVTEMDRLGSVNGNKPDVYTTNRFVFATKSSPTRSFDKSYFFGYGLSSGAIINMDIDYYDEDDFLTDSCNKIISHLYKTTSNSFLSGVLEVTYNGVTTSYTYPLRLDLSQVMVRATGVILNQSKIEF